MSTFVWGQFVISVGKFCMHVQYNKVKFDIVLAIVVLLITN